MKRGPDQKPIMPPHLNDAQIIACLDGELHGSDLQSSKGHLESCWTCRSRAGVIQASIESFVHTRQSLLPEPTVFDETRVEQFRQRLLRHSRESQTSSHVTDRVFERFVGWRGWIARIGSGILAHRQAAIASVMVACLIAVMFTDVLNTRVSADTILTRAQSYETSHSAHAGQVTRTSLRVERIARQGGDSRALGNITVVRDSQGPTYVSGQTVAAGSLEMVSRNSGAIATNLLQSVFTPGGEDDPVLRYLTAQQWIPDVSSTSFRELVASRDRKDTSVIKSGSLTELHYPFATGHVSGISEAMLTVDRDDYSPAQLSIFTGSAGDSREYRFTRTAFLVEPREVESAHLGGTVDLQGNVNGHGGSGPTHKPAPLTYLNSTANAEEVEVAAALHKADACLGEEINLFPMSDGSLLVQGLVEGPGRRGTIRESLKGIAGPLRIELFLPRELKSGAELYASPDAFSDRLPSNGGTAFTATLADLSSARMPLYDQLHKHLVQSGAAPDGIDKQIAVFSNEVVTLARQTFLHAWALRKLDREFAPERTAKLSAAALAQVEQIRQDHRRWISNLAHQQAEMLSHVADADVVAKLSNDSQTQDSTSLLRLAEEQNDLVRSLFTSSTASPETSGSLSRLLSVLQRMGS